MFQEELPIDSYDEQAHNNTFVFTYLSEYQKIIQNSIKLLVKEYDKNREKFNNIINKNRNIKKEICSNELEEYSEGKNTHCLNSICKATYHLFEKKHSVVFFENHDFPINNSKESDSKKLPIGYRKEQTNDKHNPIFMFTTQELSFIQDTIILLTGISGDNITILLKLLAEIGNIQDDICRYEMSRYETRRKCMLLDCEAKFHLYKRLKICNDEKNCQIKNGKGLCLKLHSKNLVFIKMCYSGTKCNNYYCNYDHPFGKVKREKYKDVYNFPNLENTKQIYTGYYDHPYYENNNYDSTNWGTTEQSYINHYDYTYY